jgi:hypothetical protein
MILSYSKAKTKTGEYKEYINIFVSAKQIKDTKNPEYKQVFFTLDNAFRIGEKEIAADAILDLNVIKTAMKSAKPYKK